MKIIGCNKKKVSNVFVDYYSFHIIANMQMISYFCMGMGLSLQQRIFTINYGRWFPCSSHHLVQGNFLFKARLSFWGWVSFSKKFATHGRYSNRHYSSEEIRNRNTWTLTSKTFVTVRLNDKKKKLSIHYGKHNSMYWKRRRSTHTRSR